MDDGTRDAAAFMSSPARIRHLAELAAPLLKCSTYTNSPHEIGRRIGFVVADTEEVRLSYGCRAAKALQELARIAVANIAQ